MLLGKEPEKIVVPEEIEAVVPHNLLAWQSGPKYYLIRPGSNKVSLETNYDTVNKLFENQLLSEEAKLYPSKKGSKVNVDGGKNSDGAYRRVYYKLREADDELNHKTTKIKTGSHKADKGEKANLLSDVATIYHTVPLKSGSLIEENTCKDAVIRIDNLKKLAVNNKNYVYVTCEQFLGTEAAPYLQKGWIDASVLKKEEYFSAYNWDKFGFTTIEDAGDEYMYEVSGYLGCEDTRSNFVKKLWNKIDKNDSSVIDKTELDIAYRSIEFRDIVSKIVCKHKSEWSYKASELKSEITKFFDYFINAKPSEYHSSMNELKDKNLELIEEQAGKLMFWEEAKSAVYTPTTPAEEPPQMSNDGVSVAAKEKFNFSSSDNSTLIANAESTTTKAPETKKEKDKKPERKFPGSEVYHFHPIAFINQMKLMFPGGGVAESNYEAMIRAFMRLIKEFEGVPGEKGYTTLFGGSQFSDTITHPEKPILFRTKSDGTKVYSTAAGAYQIMKVTWWDYNGEVVAKDENGKKYKTGKKNPKRNFVKKYGIADFSAKSQDEFCIALLKHARPPRGQQKGLLSDLLNGFVTKAIEEYAAHTWASFTPGRYENQGPTKGAKTKSERKEKIHEARVKQLKLYDKFLEEELAGQTDLHLEADFLKRFGIKEPDPQELIENKKKGLDLNKVIEGLNKRAGAMDTSVGYCAKYVRWALESGGMNTDGRPRSAKDYGPFLLKKGFKEVPRGDDKIGDIAVIESFTNNPHGHIEMFNGENWVSDFVQRTFYPGQSYRDAKPNYKIYRWE